MAEIIMPEVKEDTSINCWHFEEGDLVEEGDDLVRMVMNSGDNFVIPSPVSGVLSEVFFDAGDDVETGDVLAIIEEEE